MNSNRIHKLRQLPSSSWLKLGTGLGLSAGSLFVFAKLVSEILERETMDWDHWAYSALHTWDSPLVHNLMFWITQSGTGLSVAFLSLFVLAWLYFFRRNLHAIRLFLIANLGGGLLNILLKAFLQRDRPLIDPGIGAIGYSLPSGHAMGAMIFYGFIGYLVIRSRRQLITKILLSVALFGFILLMGMSRIYLNAHYASDVAAGFLAGCFWLTACILALEARPWYRKHFKTEPAETPGTLPGDSEVELPSEQSPL